MQDSYTTGAVIGLAIIAAFAADAWRRRRRARMLARAKVVGDRLLGGGLPVQGFVGTVKAPTLWDAISSWVMPRSYWPVDHDDPRTFIRLDTYVRLSPPDRLRLLLTGDLRVLATIYTDVEVKQCRAMTNIEIHPFILKE